MERRDFVKNISAGSAAMMFSPLLPVMESILKTDPGVSGGLTPFILFEDCIKVILASDRISDVFKTSLKGDLSKPSISNISRLAGVLARGEDQIITLLGQLAKAGDKKDIKYHDEKLSFALGWIMQKAASKDIVAYNQKMVKGKHSVEEIRIYQDIQVIRSRFGKQNEIDLTAEQFSSLFMEYILRVVTRIHTLTPDINDGREWIVRVTEWREQNKKTFDMYGEIFAKPDPVKLNLYVKKCILYNIEDPLILNGFQAGDVANRNSSLYAKGIINGYNALLAAQLFMDGTGDPESIRKFL